MTEAESSRSFGSLRMTRLGRMRSFASLGMTNVGLIAGLVLWLILGFGGSAWGQGPQLTTITEAVTVAQATELAATDVSMVGAAYLADLTASAVTDVTSTTVTVDAGYTPRAGEGIEVRFTDEGWGGSNDRNLAGRFNTETFTLPRFARVQDFFLRRYDSSMPAKYSRYSAALHVDFPL